jgi:hypothetical protein
MQIIRSKKTIGRLNNHRFFNPVKLMALAKKAETKQPTIVKQPKQLDLFLN